MKRGTPEHPKMKRLARLLGCHIATAVGLMEMLWHWTAKYAPCGDIGKHSDDDIADAVHFCPDMSRHVATSADFVKVLVECGWIDRDRRYRLIVHDWSDHADDATKKAVERKRIKLISHAIPPVGTSPDNGATGREKNGLPEPSQSLAKAQPSLFTDPGVPGSESIGAPDDEDLSPPEDDSEDEVSGNAPKGLVRLGQLWNEIEGIQHFRFHTKKRVDAYRVRSKNQNWMNSVKPALDLIEQSDFCKGHNDRCWQANIDWFLRPDSVFKVVEGFYNNKKMAVKAKNADVVQRAILKLQTESQQEPDCESA